MTARFLGLSSCSELEFPDSLKEIGDQAFMAERIEMNEFQRRSKREENNTLKTIVFGNSIEKIGAEAFEDKAAVKNVTIPKSVTSLAESAFNEATTVIKESEEKEPEFIILDTPDEAGFCIDANGLLWNYTSYDKSEVVVPDTVKVIGDNAGTENVEYIEANAFSGCKNLSSITIPDSVIAVRNNAFDETPWIGSRYGVIRDGSKITLDNMIYVSAEEGKEIIGNDCSTELSDETGELLIFPQTIVYIGYNLDVSGNVPNVEEGSYAEWYFKTKGVEAVSFKTPDTATDESSDTESNTATEESSDTESDTATDESSNTESDMATDEISDTESDTATDENSDTESDTATDESSDTESDTANDENSDTESDTATDEKPDTESDTDDMKGNPIGNLGDIDGDGEITAADALAVLRISVGLDTLSPTQSFLADVDGDNSITAGDALDILRYSIRHSPDVTIGKPITIK